MLGVVFGFFFLPVENALKDDKLFLQDGEYVCTHKNFAYNSGSSLTLFKENLIWLTAIQKKHILILWVRIGHLSLIIAASRA